MNITQNGIEIGPVLLSGFALVVISAIVVGAAITAYRARKKGLDGALVLDLGTAMLILGLVLGRLFYILTPPPSAAPFYSRDWYFAHFFDLLAGPIAIWNGGVGSAGAILGALLGALLVLRARGADLWEWADTLMPGALVAAAILPLANLVSGQMLGPATGLPWGIAAGGSLTPDIHYHPTPAYVALWAVASLIAAVVVRRRMGKAWHVGVWALVSWAIFVPGLFLADLLRTDASRGLLGLSGVQLLSIFLEAGLVWLLTRRLGKPAPSTPDVTNFTEN